MIELYLHSPHPPAVVLAALRAYTSEWRESQIPPILWRDGVAAIECRIAGSTCRLSYRRRTLHLGPHSESATVADE